MIDKFARCAWRAALATRFQRSSLQVAAHVLILWTRFWRSSARDMATQVISALHSALLFNLCCVLRLKVTLSVWARLSLCLSPCLPLSVCRHVGIVNVKPDPIVLAYLCSVWGQNFVAVATQWRLWRRTMRTFHLCLVCFVWITWLNIYGLHNWPSLELRAKAHTHTQSQSQS